MNKNIDEIEFAIFDTETTGLEPKEGDRIVEIAAVKIKGSQNTGTFQSLINPHRQISPGAFAVNRITADMLAGAPDINAVGQKFLDFIKDTCLCSYNAPFDLEFLDSELKLMGANFPQDIATIDILRMAKRLIPGLERYALWFVAEKLGIKKGQGHRALSDCLLTLEVFNKLREILRGKGILDFMNFTGLFGVNPRILTDINNQKIAQIQEAMDLQVKLKIKYLSASEAKISEREVIPKEIKQEKKYSYLVGYCCLRKEERHFRTDGILHIEIV